MDKKQEYLLVRVINLTAEYDNVDGNLGDEIDVTLFLKPPSGERNLLTDFLKKPGEDAFSRINWEAMEHYAEYLEAYIATKNAINNANKK